jgi:hypothetical protein
MRARTGPILAAALALYAAGAVVLTNSAYAAQSVTLKTAFIPNRLGKRTTIEFGFQVRSTTSGGAPSPVINVDLHLPAGLGLATSTLGLVGCEATALIAQGPVGCPANSRIGFGSALVVVPGELESVQEEGKLNAFLGPSNSENLEVLFYAEGSAPVSAQLVFRGQVLSDDAPFGGRIDTAIPLIPTWPGGPDVAVTSMTSTIGPLDLTYYRQVRGRTVPFHPLGIAVPKHCPRGGFPFRVDIAFLDGTRASATSTVPCP